MTVAVARIYLALTRSSRLRGALGLTLLLAAPSGLRGQAPTPEKVGLLVVAHGADSAWNARVEAVVDSVKWPGPVEMVYLMGSNAETQSWDHGLERLVEHGATRAIAVPLMVSTHGSHVRQIEFYAGERSELPSELAGMPHAHHEPGSNPIPIRVTAAIDDAPELGVVLKDRFMALTAAERQAPLVFIAHGPNAEADVPLWVSGIHRALEPLMASHAGAPIRIGLLRDDAPPTIRTAAISALRDTISTLAARAGDSVTVMTVLISSGSIDRVRIPTDLTGMPMRYVSSVLAPHPALARWITRVATMERDEWVSTPTSSAQVDRQRESHEEGRHTKHQ